MKEKNIVKILIPLVAVIVVVESIVLVSNLSSSGSKTDVVSTDTANLSSDSAEVEVSEPAADFIFETATKEMKVGKTYKVNLSLVGKRDVQIGAMEVYAKYDPSKLKISKLSISKGFPEMNKNSGIKTDLIGAILLWDSDPYSVKTGSNDVILSFEVTPKTEGTSEISLVTGNADQKSVTMIVDDSTAKPLAFLGNKLEINVTK